MSSHREVDVVDMLSVVVVYFHNSLETCHRERMSYVSEMFHSVSFPKSCWVGIKMPMKIKF